MIFSCYTHIQKEILDNLATEIIGLLENGIVVRGDNQVEVDGRIFKQVYGKFWLWILGAYEMVRTMDQAKSCFTKELFLKINELKKRLSLLRIPFAKQELAGKKQPIFAEPSVSGVDKEAKDLKFMIGDQILTMRGMISEFGRVFNFINSSSVIADHRTTYNK